MLVKPTAFKADEIFFSAFAYGGASLIDDKYASELLVMNEVVPLGGLGSFSATNLKKVLAGKHVSVSTELGNYAQSAEGMTTKKDIETFMQLLYLNFTAVRADEEAYQSYSERMKSILPHLVNNPDFVFGDSINNAVYMGNKRVAIPTVEDLNGIDYPKLLELYRSRFANAADFTFIFVGSIDMDVLKPMVEQYIASLPTVTNKPSKEYNPNILPEREGAYTNNFVFEQEVPKASIMISYLGSLPYTLVDQLQLSAFTQVLDMQMTDKIREEKGGTYGVQVSQQAQKLPKESFSLTLQFDTDPSRRVELTEAIEAVLTDLKENGPKAAQVQKVKEFMLKQHADNLEKNGYALSNLHRYYNYGVDFLTGYEQIVEGITVETLKEFAQKLLSQGNRIEVSMSTEE